MTFLYNLVFLIFSIVYLPYMIVKGKAHKDFKQRFGILPDDFGPSGKKAIWLHAVSVGEVIAVEPFAAKMKISHPEYELYISTTTITGQNTAKNLLKDKAKIFYFPLDFSFSVRKTIDSINPVLFLVFETEIWPNLINELHRRAIPVALINGRISEGSFSGYKAIKPFLSGTFSRISLFCMQTETDQKRIIGIGAPKDRVKVTGNVKYDKGLNGLNEKDVVSIAESLGIKREERFLICGSTHRGEEEKLLEVYKKLILVFPEMRILIAPRHVERSSELAGLCKKKGLQYLKMSEREAKFRYIKPVIILDTIGQLNTLYELATLVYVGGSMVKKGGHNIIEPAMFGKAIIFGRYMDNFRDMANSFLKARAAVMVQDELELESVILTLMEDKEKRAVMGENAKEIVQENKGATDRTLELVRGFLQK